MSTETLPWQIVRRDPDGKVEVLTRHPTRAEAMSFMQTLIEVTAWKAHHLKVTRR